MDDAIGLQGMGMDGETFENRLLQQGYLHLRGVLDDDGVRAYLATANQIRREEAGSWVYAADDVKPFAPLVLKRPGFLGLLDRPEVLRQVVSVLGPSVHLIASELWVRKALGAGCGDLDVVFDEAPHRDGGYLMHHLPVVLQVKAQFFLTDLPQRRMGNLGFIPGSHTWSGIEGPGTEAPSVVVTSPKAGDVVLWTNRTFHCVEPNASDVDRVSVILTYSYAWAKPFDHDQADLSAASLSATPLQRLLLGVADVDFYRAMHYNPDHRHFRARVEALESALGPLDGIYDVDAQVYDFERGTVVPGVAPLSRSS
jgi:ectoine hydroxylase-related dioxygenase (phytanoyl-CoA dioxygenase family)